MPTITDLQIITLTGKFLKLDGSVGVGTVTFQSVVTLVNTAANEIVVPATIVATLGVDGTFSVQLPATNDPDLDPVGWTYKVSEDVSGNKRTYNVSLPYDAPGSTLDLADLVPVAASGGVVVQNASIQVQDEGTPLANAGSILNFVGAGVSAAGTGPTKTITIPGSSGGALTIQDEGTSLATTAAVINFVGAGVTVTGTGSTKTVTIPGPSTVNANAVVFTPAGTIGSTNVQAAIEEVSGDVGTKLDLAGGTLTGALVLAGNATTALQATPLQQVQTLIANLVASAPGTLDTLNEIAAALGNDPNFATTITGLIAGKVSSSLFDANTILVADVDNTPQALTVGASTIVGRLSSGGIAALTPTQIKTLLAIAASDVSGFDAQVATTAILKSLVDAKGDSIWASADNTVGRLAVGTNGQKIIADSGSTFGIKWTDDLRCYRVAVLDGGGSVLTTGEKATDGHIPIDCTVVSAVALAPNESGSCAVDLWAVPRATHYPPVVGDKISASAPVSLSSARSSVDNTLTGWTTTLSAGTIVRANLASVTSLTKLYIDLIVRPR